MDGNIAKEKGYVFQGIFFSEQEIPGRIIEHIKVEISRQNSNLIEIINKKVEKVKELGGKSISNFKYGQRKHKAWELVFTFKWDTESWYGEGDVIE